MHLASKTKTKVILEAGVFEQLMLKKRRTERLAVELRNRLEDEHELLLLALHELARERGERDRAHFMRRWLREKRNHEPPVPLAPKRGGRSTNAE